MLNDSIHGEAAQVVAIEDTAQHIALAPEDAFPAVFATARMIALMEVAAARAVRPLLGEGQLSVGVTLDVRHTAATPVGGKVRATASYLGTEGKLMRFKVEAFDEAGVIGTGEHTRAIVDTARLLSGAEKRKPLSSSTIPTSSKGIQ